MEGIYFSLREPTKDKMENINPILENYELGEKEAAQFVPQPGYTGRRFDSGDKVWGHATVFEGKVVKARLFDDKEDAQRDFEEFPHPNAYSVLFNAILIRDDGTSWIESVSVEDKDTSEEQERMP
jgi:hypothetical protein